MATLVRFTFAVMILWILAVEVEATVFEVYVDCTATGIGSGTENDPYSTFFQALTVPRDYQNGDVLYIHTAPGVYREKLSKAGWRDYGIDLIVEGDPNDRAVIKGSDQLENWSHEQSGVYSTAWPYDFFNGFPEYTNEDNTIRYWFYGDDPNNIYRAEYLSRWEGLWVDGERHTQVLSRPERRPGVFLADQNHDKLYLWCSQGGSPVNRKVEAAVREQAANFFWMSDVTLRNLVFTQARIGVFGSYVSNLTIENCLIEENTTDGISVGRTNHLNVLNCEVRNNGFNGIQPSFSTNINIRNVNVHDNNWRGAIVNAGDWQVGGIKLYGVSGVYMDSVRVHNNTCAGVWFDRYSDSVVMNHCSIGYNYGTGFFWEISPGPAELNDCIIRYNGWAFNRLPKLSTTYAGVMINSGADLSLNGCTLENNLPVNVSIANTGRTAELWQYGQTGDSDPIYVTGIQVNSCEFIHYMTPDHSIYVPDWLDPENFWTNCITVTPQELADLIIPPIYQGPQQPDVTFVPAPNPSNASMVVTIHLPRRSDVRVELVNLLGRTVQNFEYSSLPEGEHKTNIDGSRLASGPYFISVYAGGKLAGVRKVFFLK